MPYKNIDELPDKVKHVLPLHAQHIYMASFNHAFEEYQDPNKRRDHHEDLEVICHKVAWAAVKYKYHKNEDGQYVEN